MWSDACTYKFKIYMFNHALFGRSLMLSPYKNCMYCIYMYAMGFPLSYAACIAFVLVLGSLFGFHFWCSLFLREGRINGERARGILRITGPRLHKKGRFVVNISDGLPPCKGKTYRLSYEILKLKMCFDVNLLPP